MAWVVAASFDGGVIVMPGDGGAMVSNMARVVAVSTYGEILVVASGVGTPPWRI